jgi:hypothetical protein
MKKIILFLILIFLIPSISLAASMSFSSDKNTFPQNEDFLVQVFLDTKGVSINALSGEVNYPADILDLKQIDDGNSAVNFWIEKPDNSVPGKISFSGITAGGFSGNSEFLFDMVFHSKKEGKASVSFENVEALQNDGIGTKTPVEVEPFDFSISNEISTDLKSNIPEIIDHNPPEDFYPMVASDPNIFDGKYFVAFSAIDKGSGIDHFEISESPWFYFGISSGKYIEAESPYVLKDQTLKSKIYIKAVDKAGNVKIAEIKAQNKVALLEQSLIIAIILLFFVYLVFLFKKIWPKFIQR